MLNDNAFKVDFYALAVEQLPVRWRKPIHSAWVKVLVTPFVLILKSLNTYRATSIYKLQDDSRIGKIEKVLNDTFDKVERRIYITEGERKNQNYCYFRAENKPPLELPIIAYLTDELAEFAADFQINIPIEVGLIPSDLTRLNTLAKYYADKDKHFTIKII
ncbi:hypothetical protein OEG92_05605 [Polaribacter sejongensis]|uniref:hypothetical protein n=1 Tax=Polaribacter sejongensis TaxID=985043 RepID=UPI0035A6602E